MRRYWRILQVCMLEADRRRWERHRDPYATLSHLAFIRSTARKVHDLRDMCKHMLALSPLAHARSIQRYQERAVQVETKIMDLLRTVQQR